MTPQEINVAIAECCGWKKCERPGYDGFWMPEGYIYDKSAYSLLKRDYDLPNYAGDLNAMHKAEKTLTQKEQERYWDELKDVIWLPVLAEYPDANRTSMNEKLTLLFSTALQRAEAFLKVKGLWK